MTNSIGHWSVVIRSFLQPGTRRLGLSPPGLVQGPKAGYGGSQPDPCWRIPAMWRSRMFWRLFGTFGVLILGSTGLLGVGLVNRVEQQYLRQLEASLRTKAVLIQEAVRDQPAEDLPRLQRRVVALRDEIAARITLLAADGRVLADSEEDPANMEKHDTRPEV